MLCIWPVLNYAFSPRYIDEFVSPNVKMRKSRGTRWKKRVWERRKKLPLPNSQFWKPVLGVFFLKAVLGCGMWLSVPTSLHFWINQMKIWNQQWLTHLNDCFSGRHITAWSNLENALLVTEREYHSHHETLLRLSEGTNFSFPSWPQFLLSCLYGTTI